MKSQELTQEDRENLVKAMLAGQAFRKESSDRAYKRKFGSEKPKPIQAESPPTKVKKRKMSKGEIFVRSPEWRELRQQALDHYGAVCMCCGSVENIQVDHIKPKSKFPELALEFLNLQILCWKCNRKKNNTGEEDYRLLN